MTPLILRPAPQGEALAAQLRQAGHTPIVCPLFTQVAGTDLARLPTQLARSPLLIAVSAAAVDHASHWLATHGLAWPNTPVFAVGAATAARWQAAGCSPVWPDDERSEGLAALPGLQPLAGQRVLILRGEPGREWLADTLRARGAEVEYCQCYQRQWLPYDGDALFLSWRTAGVDSVILTSGDILHHWLSLLPAPARAWAQQLDYVVPSHRVAELVVSAGLPAPRVANGASHDALCQALGEKD